jgi:hypothetical protein
MIYMSATFSKSVCNPDQTLLIWVMGVEVW